MKLFDNYEISPCRRYEEQDSPGKFYFEVCQPEEADVWTLYGHVKGEGVQAVGDFANREHAEKVFFSITGVKFTGSYKADAHLRIMHAGQKLLHAAEAARRRAANDEKLSIQECDELSAAIAKATGEDSPDLRKPIVIEVRGGVVQEVLNVPSGIEYEIRDYDNLDDHEDAAKERIMTAHRNSPAPWTYGYSPYQGRNGEIPAFEIFDADGNKVFDTNEDTPAELQEANARIGAAAPRLLEALVTCTKLLADHDASDGEEGESYREAVAAITEATGCVAEPSSYHQ